MKKVIVSGGRDYNDAAMVYDVLDFIKPDILIEGGCPTGADQIARDWRDNNGLQPNTYEADWKRLGRAAGPIRNEKMCSENTDAILIAFPGGTGTNGCVNIAKKLNMIIMRVEA
jgi:hypothetical protein